MSNEHYRPWRTAMPGEFESVAHWQMTLRLHEAAALEHTAHAYAQATAARNLIGRPANAEAPMQALIDSVRSHAA